MAYSSSRRCIYLKFEDVLALCWRMISLYKDRQDVHLDREGTVAAKCKALLAAHPDASNDPDSTCVLKHRTILNQRPVLSSRKASIELTRVVGVTFV